MKFLKLKKNDFLYFLLLSFVFISSTALAISKKELITEKLTSLLNTKTYPSLPVLASETDTFPIISAQSVLAIDLDSGVTLYEKDADKILLPASTTKIVTALVSLDYYKGSDVLVVDGTSIVGQKMGLVTGEKITARDLLFGLLVFSANDAAEVLAENYLGGREAFVMAMNDKAREFNLTNTHFINPSGLEDIGHISTARDLVRISTEAMKDKRFREMVGTKNYVAESVDAKNVHRLTNINQLLGKVDGVLGVKTGWTENARENLVTYLEKDGKKIMIALLGSQDRFGETEELINWIFDNYEWEEVYSP